MQFRILGPLEVVDGERVLDVGPPKQRAVLALLLLDANHVVSLDRLIDELWGEEPPARAAGTLQSYISNLRRALEPSRSAREHPHVLVTQPPGYVLHAEPGAVDAAQFEALASEARRLLADGNPAEALRLQDEALGLWRGRALADFAFDSFARAEAGRLEELRLVTLEDRLQALTDLGRHAEVVPTAEALVTTYPLRERVWGLLMTALYRSGRQVDALRAYQTARAALVEELGIEPGPALRQLEADVLNQAASLDWREPAPAVPATVAERPVSTELPAAAAAASPPRLAAGAGRLVVGRQEELACLDTALDDASARRGQVVLIRGEPGIGKTRLVEEAAARARARGWQVGWGSSLEGGATPAFWPWVGVVRDLLADNDPDVLRRAMLGRDVDLAQVVPEVKELSGPLEAPPMLDPETARLRLFEATVGFLGTLSRDRPLVMVLDDLQWADVASLQLLSFVGARVRDTSMVVVGTYRPAEVDHLHPLAETLAVLARHQVVTRIELGGLDEGDVADLITATTGSAAEPDVVATVQARTRGNPFFVAELARLLQSRHELRGDVIAKAVPAGVRDVVRRRVARLPEQTAALLSLAAVAGREFELGVLEVAAELDSEQALEGVEASIVSGLVVEDPEVVGRLRFSHDLVRETLIEELTGLRRARLHARLARALDALYGDDDRHAVERAHHYHSALPATGSAGADRAVACALRAADVEMSRLAHEQGEAHLRQALETARSLAPGPDRDRRELEVLLPLSSWLMMSRGYAAPETGEVFTAARQLCERMGETRHLVRALYGLMAFDLVGARYDSCRGYGDRLLAVATDSGDPAALVAAHQSIGVVALQQGDLDLAHRHLEAAFALEEGQHDPWLVSWFPIHPVVAIRAFLSWAVWERGDRERSWKLAEEAADYALRHTDELSIAHGLHFVCWIAAIDRNPERAVQAAEEAHSRSQGRFPLYEAITGVLWGWARSALGQADEGLTQLTASLEAMEATGAWMVHSYYLALLAEAQRWAGRPEEALATVERAFRFAEDRNEGFYLPDLHRLRGELISELFPDRRREAMDEIERGVAVARVQGNRGLEKRAVQSLRSVSVPYPP